MSRQAQAPQARVIAVVGATGQQGGAVVRSLLTSGAWTVRAVVRDPESDAARALADAGAELVRADLDQPETLRAAFDGAHGVYSVQSFTGPDGIAGEIRQGKAVADAAKDAGVAHLVYASIDGAERASGVPHFESKFTIEQHIASLGQPATMLRLVAFMDNFGTYAMPSLVNGEIVIAWPPKADTRIQLVAAEDIGVVAAKVFADPDQFIGATPKVAGDELSMTEMAQAFTNVTGTPARYEESDIEQVRTYSEDLAHMYEFFEHKGFQADLAEVRRLHPDARTLEDWIRETNWQPRANAWS
ncbi:NmrA/HSCARG family protein [Oerskovia sp. KBS0722]|nr:NmrA/HSCARG family protein [Oerskovia sp. KBS0722]